MIDEKKLIEDLQKWTQDDLYSPKHFQTLVEAQPRILKKFNNYRPLKKLWNESRRGDCK